MPEMDSTNGCFGSVITENVEFGIQYTKIFQLMMKKCWNVI